MTEPVVTMKQLLEARVHFGHQTRRWNPKMKRFIFGERNGIYIIDLQETLRRLEVAYTFVRDSVADGGTVLFVGTKKQAQDPIQSYAEKCGMPYINERWLGGMLTNFETISKRVAKMAEYRRMRDSGEFEAMPKKEALLISRELAKLERNLGGIAKMEKLPSVVFILDTKEEHIAVTEANKLGIPIVAVVDTNCDPDIIQYVIPGNDDAIRSGALMCRVIADAVDEGRLMASKRPGAAPVARERTAEEEAAVAAQQAEARRQAAQAAAEREARIAAQQAAPQPDAEAEAPAAAEAETPEETTPMPEFTAKDVQALRQSTGAGMMDAKKALTENGGDFEAATKWLREKGLAKSAAREDRDNSQGTVAVSLVDGVAAIAQLKCETDFVAKSDQFSDLVQEIATIVAIEGEEAAAKKDEAIDDLKVVLKENIERGQIVRFAAAEGNIIDTYVHRQDGRGVLGVIVELEGGSNELAHDIAVHIAFTKPAYLTADEVPADEVAKERETLEAITRAEGKPEQAIEKIVDGRIGAWLKERVLIDQPYVKDDKQTIKQLLGSASIARFAVVSIGA